MCKTCELWEDVEDDTSSLFDDDRFTQLPDGTDVSPMQRAGIDEHTPVDTVLRRQGADTFVTEEV